MKKYHPEEGLAALCRLFGKSRQSFYDHGNRESSSSLKEGLILSRVRELRALMPRLGTLKLHLLLKEELKDHHIHIGRDRLYKLLSEHNLLVRRNKRKYVVTTNSNHPFRKYSDLRTALVPDGPNQLWVSDITYLSTTNGFLYLSLVTDAYSRKIVGYHLSQQLKAKGTVIALKKAIGSLPVGTKGLIHHSDRGIQYCCHPYVSMLQEHGIAVSMTQSGSVYDNALAERVNGILKTELGLGAVFASYAPAVAAVHQAISTYNHKRPHMSIGMLTPQKAHDKTGTLKRKWKLRTYKPCQTPLLYQL